MNETDHNARLYEKMKAEQDKYRDWLLHQEPSEILNHTYEYRGSDVPPGESARNIKIGRVSVLETRPIFLRLFLRSRCHSRGSSCSACCSRESRNSPNTALSAFFRTATASSKRLK